MAKIQVIDRDGQPQTIELAEGRVHIVEGQVLNYILTPTKDYFFTKEGVFDGAEDPKD